MDYADYNFLRARKSSHRQPLGVEKQYPVSPAALAIWSCQVIQIAPD